VRNGMRVDPRPAQRRGVSGLTCSGDARAGEQMLAFRIEVVGVAKAKCVTRAPVIAASCSRDLSASGTVGLRAGCDLINDSGGRRLGGANDGSTTSLCSAPSTTRVALRSSVIRTFPT
jgi:hypothetical protein